MAESASDRRRQFDRVVHLFPRLRERRRQLGKTLSGGEQQMLAIGRALIGEPKLCWSTSRRKGLRPMIVNEIFEALGRMRDEGIALLLVEQNVRRAAAIERLLLRDGKGPDRRPGLPLGRDGG